MNLPSGNGNGGRDRTFLMILGGFGFLAVCFGGAAMLLIGFGHPSDQVVLRLVTAMGSLFTGMLGLAIGYLTGRR
jgi:hypothetical protein